MTTTTKDWLQSPIAWGDWGRRVNGWFGDLLRDVRGIDTRVSTLESNVRTTPATHTIVNADIYTAGPSGWTLDAATYAPPTAFVDETGLVTWDGIVRNLTGTTNLAGVSVAAVRTGYLPTTRTLVVPVASSVVGQHLYIAPSGLVTTGLDTPHNGFISLAWSYRL